jgi:predicted AAA+ superfamily ATPase
MALKPWYKVVTPREDLREGKPLDAAEFAVHLDQVRDGRAPKVYQNPEQFFERTYLTQNLIQVASEVIRRLSGEKTETSAVFNMATQFGGGKTHALTLLYHLANNASKAKGLPGINQLIAKAGIKEIPLAATAVFVGTEFDSITGRGGNDGTPNRKTPWGEIAFQLRGEQGLAVVAEHEARMIAPAGDVIRKILPDDRPCLILMDELMNYVSRNRKSGLSTQFYDFLQNLSETARGSDQMVLAISIPASEMEMTAEDQSDYNRLKKLLDRLGKAVILAAESETSEIIRRRLFEWYGLPEDGKKTVAEYADWVLDHRQQVPNWFPVDHAREAFESTYPFHPLVLSVFERKWQALPRFQQTRGIGCWPSGSRRPILKDLRVITETP